MSASCDSVTGRFRHGIGEKGPSPPKHTLKSSENRYYPQEAQNLALAACGRSGFSNQGSTAADLANIKKTILSTGSQLCIEARACLFEAHLTFGVVPSFSNSRTWF